jgi:AraC-like DNA-binding protein
MQPLILWVNLTGVTGVSLLCTRLKVHARVYCVERADTLDELVASIKPDVICFDFIDPDTSQRLLIQRFRLEYPGIPVLLFTTSHCAQLMVWALRTRIWDCFIKPVSCGEVMRRLNMLLPALKDGQRERGRKLLMPERATYAVQPPQHGDNATFRTSAVLPYLQQHFQEKIASLKVARMCDMDPFAFSRAFRREQGVTFRDYLIRLRIEAAAVALRSSDMSILDVACSVGFNDPSHFARLFRRHMGVTPRAYRNGARTDPPPAGDKCATA